MQCKYWMGTKQACCFLYIAYKFIIHSYICKIREYTAKEKGLWAWCMTLRARGWLFFVTCKLTLSGTVRKAAIAPASKPKHALFTSMLTCAHDFRDYFRKCGHYVHSFLSRILDLGEMSAQNLKRTVRLSESWRWYYDVWVSDPL